MLVGTQHRRRERLDGNGFRQEIVHAALLVRCAVCNCAVRCLRDYVDWRDNVLVLQFRADVSGALFTIHRLHGYVHEDTLRTRLCRLRGLFTQDVQTLHAIARDAHMGTSQLAQQPLHQLAIHSIVLDQQDAQIANAKIHRRLVKDH